MDSEHRHLIADERKHIGRRARDHHFSNSRKMAQAEKTEFYSGAHHSIGSLLSPRSRNTGFAGRKNTKVSDNSLIENNLSSDKFGMRKQSASRHNNSRNRKGKKGTKIKTPRLGTKHLSTSSSKASQGGEYNEKGYSTAQLNVLSSKGSLIPSLDAQMGIWQQSKESLGRRMNNNHNHIFQLNL